MFRCLRCGLEVVRQSADQVHCIRCAREVAELIAGDQRRRKPRFAAKDLTGAVR